MTGILIKRGNSGTDTHAGKMPSEVEGRDPGNISTGQGKPKFASKPPEAREKAWKKFSLTALRKNQP